VSFYPSVLLKTHVSHWLGHVFSRETLKVDVLYSNGIVTDLDVTKVYMWTFQWAVWLPSCSLHWW